MAFFARRKALEALEARERAGESLWVDRFGPSSLGRLVHAMDDVGGHYQTPYRLARDYILHDLGRFQLSKTPKPDVRQDLIGYMVEGGPDEAATAIEAYGQALRSTEHAQETYGQTGADYFKTEVNRILREDRISFEFVEGEMIPFTSRELHVHVVAPTLRLLAREGWEKVEAAYQEAIAQLADGNAPNAVTDAGTALQEALIKLGARGNALGPLIKSARGMGLLAGHDEALADSLRAAAEWASADRSNSGDAHMVSGSTTDDAWFIIHVVGALLLRLSSNTPRAAQ